VIQEDEGTTQKSPLCQKKSESKGLQLPNLLGKLKKFKKDYKTMILNGHNMGITSLSLSPDGSKLASGSFDGTVIIWDIKTGRQITICERT